MTVQEIIEDVIHRVGKGLLQEHGEYFFLRALNRIYHRLNAEYNPLIETTTLAAGAFSSSVSTYTLPSRYIRLINMEEVWNYVPPALFKSDLRYSWTILGLTLHFTDVDADTTMTLRWYSRGKDLVTVYSATPPDTDAEATSPEWPGDLHQMLIYETAMELSPNYPLLQKDAMEALRLRNRLAAIKHVSQIVQPQTMHDGRLYNNPNNVNRSDLDDLGDFDYGGTW
ncbi:MAG: hypothetical protein KDI38_03620 [Calditrichaeota bacterium]|nr:hypothetical protein [Calditrichota bacterium]